VSAQLAFVAILLIPALPISADESPSAACLDASAQSQEVVAVVDGSAITRKAFNELVGQRLIQLRTEEYQIGRRILEQHIDTMLLAKEATRRGVSVEQLLRDEVDGKTPAPDRREVANMYEAFKDNFRGTPEPDALAQIEKRIVAREAEKRKAALLQHLREAAGVSIKLPPPRVAGDIARGPAVGPDTAPVRIVAFSDFHCPYCRRASETLREVQARYGGSVRMVYRHYPLPSHPGAAKASEAAECANEQGRFWPMHDVLFGESPATTDADYARLAEKAGVNVDKFRDCMKSGRAESVWQRDKEEAALLGVRSTPTFFVNGRLVSGAKSADAFAEIIDEELRARAAGDQNPKAASGEFK